MDDEEDDGFLVPHGHLSDDELEEDERMVYGSMYLVELAFSELGRENE